MSLPGEGAGEETSIEGDGLNPPRGREEVMVDLCACVCVYMGMGV